MSYVLGRDETIESAILRIMQEQIERARAHLTDEASSPAERVHDARRRIKETRALLRMIRRPLGRHFAVENRAFRDAARELASARDDAAVLETLDTLAKVRKVSRLTARRARKVLTSTHQEAPGDLEARLARVSAALGESLLRLDTWPHLANSFGTIGEGLARTYQDGRLTLARAVEIYDPSELHEWRKHVKDHWYHLQLLHPIWPSMMESSARALKELSRILGEHHDLFVLRNLVAVRAGEIGGQRAVIRLLDSIDDRQRELELAAATSGRRIYAEGAGRWLARIRKYWELWQHE
ncbi:MAG TPA: CHAD domain-containing protein [Thermoanaerobaculia bacterium]